MRGLTFIGLLLVLISAHAQRLTTQTYFQQTVMGVQQGFGLRYEWKKVGVGGVFQQTMNAASETLSATRYPFYGVEAFVKLADCGNVSFALTPKAGFVDERFFVIIPEVETSISVNKFIDVAIGTGLRARQASASFKVLVQPQNIFR